MCLTGHIMRTLRFYIITKCYGLNQGKIYGIFESRKSVVIRMQRLGMNVHALPDSPIIEENIPKGDIEYYTSSTRPLLYMVKSVQVKKALTKTVQKLVESKKIIFDTSLR